MAKFIKRQGTEKVKVAFAVMVRNLTFPATNSVPDGSKLSVVFVRGSRTTATADAEAGGGCCRWQQGLELAATLYRDKKAATYQSKEGQLQIRCSPAGGGRQRIVGTVTLKLHKLLSPEPIDQTLKVESFPVAGACLTVTVTSRFMREDEDDGQSSVYSASSRTSSISASLNSASGRGGKNNRDKPDFNRTGGTLESERGEGEEGEESFRGRARSFSNPFEDQEGEGNASPASVFDADHNPFAVKKPSQQQQRQQLDGSLDEGEENENDEEGDNGAASSPEWGRAYGGSGHGSSNANNGGKGGGNGGFSNNNNISAYSSGASNGYGRYESDSRRGSATNAYGGGGNSEEDLERARAAEIAAAQAASSDLALATAAAAAANAANARNAGEQRQPSEERGRRGFPRFPLGAKHSKTAKKQNSGGGGSNSNSFDENASVDGGSVGGERSGGRSSRSQSPGLNPVKWVGQQLTKKRSSHANMSASAAAAAVSAENRRTGDAVAAYVMSIAAEAGGDVDFERDLLRRRLAETRAELEVLTYELIRTKLQVAQLATEHDVLLKVNADLNRSSVVKGKGVRLGRGG